MRGNGRDSYLFFSGVFLTGAFGSGAVLWPGALFGASSVLSAEPGAGAGDRKQIRSGGAGRPLHLRPSSDLFTAYLLYGVLSTFALLGGILIVMWGFGRRRPTS